MSETFMKKVELEDQKRECTPKSLRAFMKVQETYIKVATGLLNRWMNVAPITGEFI